MVRGGSCLGIGGSVYVIQRDVPFGEIVNRPPVRIDGGVLDFIGGSSDDYCGNFGKQWNRFREIQIDSISGRDESRRRFFAETGLDPLDLKGKVVLDAGCGAGRFAEIAAECGARVVAVDMSTAVHACAQTLSRFPASQCLVVRADLRDLPFGPGMFDAIFSLGMLHHTPDPIGTLKGLVRFLSSGGSLATWIYEKRFPGISWIFPRTWIRRAVRGWPLSGIYVLSIVVTTAFFPAGWAFSWFGRVGRRLASFLPYASRHLEGRGSLVRQWNYSVLDTFDWYGPRYELAQSEKEVMAAMRGCGLLNVKRLPTRGMAIVGTAPKIGRAEV
jgi:SAM-dependent methyltransferase